MRWNLLLSSVALGVMSGAVAGDEPKGKDEPKAGPLVLKIVAKKTTYAWDGGGKTPAEFKKHLEEVAAAIKAGKDPNVKWPPAPPVELTLQITNTGKEDVTVYVGGDPNVFTLELKGPGVFTLSPPLAFTADFRLPRGMKLEPGKSYEIPLKSLTDGFRGASRLVYWTEPGDYTLSATYQLADAGGEKGAVLKSQPIKLKVEKAK